jgi:hypothetical protein
MYYGASAGVQNPGLADAARSQKQQTQMSRVFRIADHDISMPI